MPREHHLPATASLPSLARICPATHPLYYRTHNKILDGDGNAYYMNAETGESRWDLPVVPAEPDDLAAAGALVAGEAGMEADEALGYTLHSWRHLLPTAARQLRLSESDQVEIGHWTTGSAMPRRYDSAA